MVWEEGGLVLGGWLLSRLLFLFLLGGGGLFLCGEIPPGLSLLFSLRILAFPCVHVHFLEAGLRGVEGAMGCLGLRCLQRDDNKSSECRMRRSISAQPCQ